VPWLETQLADSLPSTLPFVFICRNILNVACLLLCCWCSSARDVVRSTAFPLYAELTQGLLQLLAAQAQLELGGGRVPLHTTGSTAATGSPAAAGPGVQLLHLQSALLSSERPRHPFLKDVNSRALLQLELQHKEEVPGKGLHGGSSLHHSSSGSSHSSTTMSSSNHSTGVSGSASGKHAARSMGKGAAAGRKCNQAVLAQAGGATTSSSQGQDQQRHLSQQQQQQQHQVEGASVLRLVDLASLCGLHRAGHQEAAARWVGLLAGAGTSHACSTAPVCAAAVLARVPRLPHCKRLIFTPNLHLDAAEFACRDWPNL
jgi:hypothetical protein